MDGEGSSHAIFGMPEPKEAAILYMFIADFIVCYCHWMLNK